MRFAAKAIRFRKSWFIALFPLAVLAGCSGKSASFADPKGLLRDYISESFSAESLKDRDALLRYLTGAARNRLAAWSDQQFSDAFIKSRRQLIKLEFVDFKESEPETVGITYELTYLDQGRGQDTKVIQKKIAQLVRRDQRWYISEVKNLKEMIEYKNEMSLP